jgi:hypothetical protein
MKNLFNKLEIDPTLIDKRIFQKITLGEFFALSFTVGMVIVFIIINPDSLHYDLSNYLKTSNGDFSFYYYAYWFVPVFDLLGKIPVTISFIFWDVISIISVFVAVRVFGGRPTITLISYQMLYILFQGQMTAWIIGALAMLWWGMAHKRWSIAGLALLVASTKFQSGLIFAAALWFLADISWKDRMRVISLPIIFSAISLIVFPGWPFQLLSVIQNNPPNELGSFTLWRWIGPSVLLFWLPPLLLPLKKEKRLIALVSTTCFALPYFQQADLLVLFSLPIGWFPILGNFGYLSHWLGYSVLHLLVFIPLVLYFIIIIPSFQQITVSYFKKEKDNIE